MFAHSEVSERTFKTLLRKIENQSYRLSIGKTQIRGKSEVKESSIIDIIADIILRIWDKDTNPEYVQTYLKARTRTVIASRVLRDLNDLDKIAFLRDHSALETTRKIYKQFEEQAEKARKEIFEEYRKELLPIDSTLAEKSLSLTKLRALDALIEKGSLSPKIGNILKEEIEHSLYAALKI